MAGLPKSYIKKYGISKKAWREYRKSKGGKKKTRKASKRKTSRRTYTMAKKRRGSVRANKILGLYGMSGALEDVAIGYIGSNIFMGMGYPLESALPMSRVAQGGIGVLLNRRGKGRLPYAILDLIDVYLLKRGLPIQGISLKQWM